MKLIKYKFIIKYISLILVVSYFLFHNIFLVFSGIIFALYQLNISKFENITINKVNVKEINQKNVINITEKSLSEEITSDIKLNSLSLVEAVDELGFIPSIENNKDNLV